MKIDPQASFPTKRIVCHGQSPALPSLPKGVNDENENTYFVYDRRCGIVRIPGLARASQVIVSNLALDGQPGQFSPSQIDPSDSWAQEFTTGGYFTLQSVVANLGELNTGTNGDFTLTAQLYSVTNAGDNPSLGTLLASFSQVGPIPTAPNVYSNVEFDPTSPVSLNPSSFYWFVLSGSSSDGTGSVQWQFTDSSVTTGPGTLSAYAAFAAGYGWTVTPSIPPPFSPFLIEVDGVAVPEPSSLLLGCVGFGRSLVCSPADGEGSAPRLIDP